MNRALFFSVQVTTQVDRYLYYNCFPCSFKASSKSTTSRGELLRHNFDASTRDVTEAHLLTSSTFYSFGGNASHLPDLLMSINCSRLNIAIRALILRLNWWHMKMC